MDYEGYKLLNKCLSEDLGLFQSNFVVVPQLTEVQETRFVTVETSLSSALVLNAIAKAGLMNRGSASQRGNYLPVFEVIDAADGSITLEDMNFPVTGGEVV